MKILVTGSRGFVGKNLLAELNNQGLTDILEFTLDNDIEELDDLCTDVDFVFHLAGVNRPDDDSEFKVGNFDLTTRLIEALKKNNNQAPIVLSSSIQAENDSPYGISKKAAEDALLQYGIENDVDVYIFRFSNLFGKWSSPNYNSVVATFCYNIARGLDININDPEHEINLVYIDDVLTAMLGALQGKVSSSTIDSEKCLSISPHYPVTIGRLAELIQSFADQRMTRVLPDLSDPFIKKLYSTYISYLPEQEFSYPLIEHRDERGVFAEFVRSHKSGSGQVSVNITKPGEVKGNHWHHTKFEKFLVVYGEAELNLRDIFSDEIITYKVSDKRLEVVDIPVGYVHDIVNVGDTDLVTIIWVNENYDPENHDTYALEV